MENKVAILPFPESLHQVALDWHDLVVAFVEVIAHQLLHLDRHPPVVEVLIHHSLCWWNLHATYDSLDKGEVVLVHSCDPGVDLFWCKVFRLHECDHVFYCSVGFEYLLSYWPCFVEFLGSNDLVCYSCPFSERPSGVSVFNFEQSDLALAPSYVFLFGIGTVSSEVTLQNFSVSLSQDAENIQHCLVFKNPAGILLTP